MSSETSSRYASLFRTLTPPERDALERKVLLDQSPAEIAAHVGLTQGGVRSRIYRAIKKVKQNLTGFPDLRRIFIEE